MICSNVQCVLYHCSSTPDDGILTPKEVTGGLKVKETNRTVYYAK